MLRMSSRRRRRLDISRSARKAGRAEVFLPRSFGNVAAASNDRE